tara:strand:+ start:13376 stop:14404 length:1029 start_codon:yes stop_codon:yes gene_type:complete
MTMSRILVVYNICGVKRDNTSVYPAFLQSIENQTFDGEVVVAVSACQPREGTIPHLKEQFPHFHYNVIDDLYPVNVTFNKTVLDCVDRFGAFDGYFYQACDVSMNTPDIYQGLFNSLKSNASAAFIAAQIDVDSCYAYGLKLGGGRHGFDDERARYEMFKEGADYTVPVGKACATHLLLFSHDILEYYGRLLPDLFAGNCTESIFSFICAGIKRNWLISKDYHISHVAGLDTPSAGFRAESRDPSSYPYDYPIPQFAQYHEDNGLDEGQASADSLLHIFQNEYARSIGLGYEECENIAMHDPSQFDHNQFCTNDELAPYIREHAYVRKEILDYDTIGSKFYE